MDPTQDTSDFEQASPAGEEPASTPAPEATASTAEPKAEAPSEKKDQYDATFRELSAGDIVNGLVVHIDEHGVLVDVGTKSEGMIPNEELSERGGGERGQLNVGDRIDVYVLKTEGEHGNLLLSKKKADYERVWREITEAHEKGEILSAMVTDRVKGGLVVDMGLRGFLPASHVATKNVHTLDRFVGQSVRLKVIEVDRNRKRVVVSQKLAVEEERTRKRSHTLASLEENQVRKGVVRRVTDYGAFVDLGGVDGLLHVTEMSWTRVNHPSDVVKVGDRIEVLVLKFDRENEKISLGLKQILPDPWQHMAERYAVGEVVPAVVTRLVPFGAFAQLEGGIEGIIPNSELSEHRVAKPDEVVAVGDKVQVKILSIKPGERRMSLSMRQVQQDRERQEYREYITASQDESRVTLGDLVGDVLGRVGQDQEEK